MTVNNHPANETKVVKQKPHPFKILYFYSLVLTLIFVFSFLVILWSPFAILYDKKRNSLHAISTVWANLTMALFPWWKISLSGVENLPGRDETVIYVANHSAAADILVIYKVRRQFRWIAKDSLFKIPFLGWGMRLIGYVPVNRNTNAGRFKSFEKSKERLRAGTSMFFFPEGTRSRDGKLKKFHSGAFKLALDTKTPIIPISISSAQDLTAKGLKPNQTAQVNVHVHPKISVEGKNVETLIKESRDAVEKGLKH